jgi:hypothetical protein
VSLYIHHLTALTADRRARDATRPEFTGALDLDFYDPSDQAKPMDARRYCVAQFIWRGKSWRRVRKLCGPKTFDAALDELMIHIRRTGLPHVADA